MIATLVKLKVFQGSTTCQKHMLNTKKNSKPPTHIPLTPGQSVTIHGWLRPKDTLCWTDVLANGSLTMDFLNNKTKITKELLHHMQPDIKAWVQSGRVRIEDAPQFMHVWPAHPFNDLKADLDDVINFKWDAKTMRATGVAYSDLCDAGMTHETMAFFGYTLYEWSTLGFGRAEAELLSVPDTWRLFHMNKADVLRCLA